MNIGIKHLIIFSAIVLAFLLTSQTARAENYLRSSQLSSSTHTAITADQKTIIGGFKTVTGQSSSVATMGDIAATVPVVEPPAAIDGIAIIEKVEPPEPANNILTGYGEDKPPIASADFNIEQAGSVELDWMAAYIDTVLQDQVVGYAYAINKDGSIVRSGANGFARTADDGQLDMSIHTRSFVASVSKQVTAVATIKILHQAGLTVDTLIEDYLPAEWLKSGGFWGKNGLTFGDLMTHSTGLGQAFDLMKANDDVTALASWGNDWDGLEFVVSNGADPGASYSYKNANYALLRVLIPEVWVQMGGAPYDEVTEANHSLMYLAYVYQNVFEPAGVYNVTCWVQSAQEEALAYSKDFVEEGGVAHEINFSSCGGHSGFRLSAYQLAKYLAYLRHSDEIITYQQLNQINQALLGWSSSAENGIYWKGGDNYSNYIIGADNNIGGQVFATQSTVEFRKSSHACVMIFPNGYEASIVINSEYKTGFESSACGVLKDAYSFTVSQ